MVYGDKLAQSYMHSCTAKAEKNKLFWTIHCHSISTYYVCQAPLIYRRCSKTVSVVWHNQIYVKPALNMHFVFSVSDIKA